MIDEDALPDREARLAQSQQAAERIEAAGYVPIGIDHFARPDDPLARARPGPAGSAGISRAIPRMAARP